jgi:hypothetical protein
MAKASSRGSGLPESTTATLAWRQRRVGRPGLGNVSASVGAGTGSGCVVEVRRWLGSICAATCLRGQTFVIKGETSPALECPITRAPDGVVSREGGRLAGQTNDRWCHEGVVRTHASVATGEAARSPQVPQGAGGNGTDKPKAGTAFPVRSFWRRNAPDRRRTDRVTSRKDVARLRTTTGDEALRPTCSTTSGGADRPRGSIGHVGGKTSEGKTPKAPPA